MRKSPFKRWITVLFVFLIVNLLLNVGLVPLKQKVLRRFNERFPLVFSLRNSFYIFPNIFILTDASGAQATNRSRKIFRIPLTTTQISLPALLLRHQIIFSSITLYYPRGEYDEILHFIKDHAAEIRELLKRIPVAKTRLHFKEGLFQVSNASDSGQLFLDYKFSVENRKFLLRGVVRGDAFDPEMKKTVQGEPLNFLLKGKTGKEIIFDSLNFSQEHFESQLWGYLDQDTVQLNGYTLVSPSGSKEKGVPQISQWEFLKRMDFLRRNRTYQSISAKSFDPNIFILDMDCRLKISMEKIMTERFWFTVNDIPVNINGSVMFKDPARLNITATFYPLRTKMFKDGILEKGNIQIEGDVDGNGFKGDTRFNFNFVSNKFSKLSMDKMEVLLTGTRLNLRRNYLEGHVDEGKLTLWANENSHQVEWKDLKAVVNLASEDPKIIELEGPFKGGKFEGKIWVSSDDERLTATAKLTDINAAELQDLLVHFSKVTGRLSAEMVFNSAPAINLKGNINIQDGSISNFDFFNWLADTFSLPSLRLVNFKNSQLEFLLSDEESGFKNILMDSDLLDVAGTFMIDKDTFVHSELSLGFTKQLLRESRKFGFILKSFKEDEAINFDFKLSGSFENMNFQWMDSPTKEKIQRRIPNFIERRIDRRMERLLEAPKQQVPPEALPTSFEPEP